jgi:pyruvyl transferase EpsO
LLRSNADKERARHIHRRRRPFTLTARQLDWADERTLYWRLSDPQLRCASLFDRTFRPSRGLDWRERRAMWQLQRGINILSAGHLAITDRLHGHIISILLGLPHALIDDAFGKIGNFARAWTLPGSAWQLCETVGDAERWLHRR